jgi:hypothetical protein
MRNTDYAGNFSAPSLRSLQKRNPSASGSAPRSPIVASNLVPENEPAKIPRRVIVPPIFPDNDIVRNDLLDYFVEIEHFDSQVSRAIALLEKSGQLDNTIIVVTSDHGMPFPRAKASLYDDGSRIPLAIRWPKGITKPGRTIDDLDQPKRPCPHLPRRPQASNRQA